MENDLNPREFDDDAMQSMIGKQLRSLYDSVLAEPIPDNIVRLLTQLDDLTSEPSDLRDDRNAADEADEAE